MYRALPGIEPSTDCESGELTVRSGIVLCAVNSVRPSTPLVDKATPFDHELKQLLVSLESTKIRVSGEVSLVDSSYP